MSFFVGKGKPLGKKNEVVDIFFPVSFFWDEAVGYQVDAMSLPPEPVAKGVGYGFS